MAQNAESGDLPSSTAAALFDLRSVIALLFAVYGIVLTVMGVTGTSDAELAKAGGIDINLWTGIAMLLMAIGFALWVRLRPPVVAAPVDLEETDDDPEKRLDRA